MTARFLDARVYLEGVRIPFTSVSITERVGDYSTACHVAIPPSKALRGIEARTLLHVSVRRTSPAYEDGYVCVFEGEVGGWGHSRSAAGGRGMQVVAFTLSNYWQFIKQQYFEEAASNTNVAAQATSTEQLKGFNVTEAVRLFSVTEQSNQAAVALNSSIHDAFAGRTFPDGLRELFRLAFTAIDGKRQQYQFPIDANDRLRLLERLVVAATEPDDLMAKESFNFWIAKLTHSQGGFIDFDAVLSTALGAVFHDYVAPAAPLVRSGVTGLNTARQDVIREIIRDPENAGAQLEELRDLEASSSSAQEPGSYVVKPNLYFVPPPTCNILFPGQYSSERFGRSFFDEPTRAYFPSKPPNMNLTPDTGVAELTYESPCIAPFANFDGTQLTVGRTGKITEGGTPITKTLDEIRATGIWGVEYGFLTDRELKEGLNPAVMRWPPLPEFLDEEQVRMGSDQGARKDPGDSRYKQIADWLYWRAFYSVGRSQDVTGEYNPGLVAGFPVITLDASPAGLHLVGYLQSVQHNFDANSNSGTSFSMELCRDVGEERPKFIGASLPRWMDPEKFADDKIGTQFYPGVLGPGVKSLADYAGDDESDPIESAADALGQTYAELEKLDGDGAMIFMDTVSRRPFVTTDEVMAFLGATKVSDDRYDGDVFDDDRRAVVLAHLEETSFGAVEG